MATTYGMTAPIMSSTMPNPMVMAQTAMAPSMMGQSTMGMNNANMTLPLSMNRPIEVTELTLNLEEIQNFPVAGRALDGTHFHQDPVTGQMYKMSEELHQRIPQILADRKSSQISTTPSDTVTKYLNDLMGYTSKNENLVTDVQTEQQSSSLINSKNILDSALGIVNIQDSGRNITLTQPNTLSVSRNINVPGIMTEQQKMDLEKSLQTQVNTNLQSFVAQTAVNQTNIPVQMNGFTTKINYPVNRFLNVGKNEYILSQNNNVVQPTNSFVNTSTLTNTYGGSSNRFVPINKFYNTK